MLVYFSNEYNIIIIHITYNTDINLLLSRYNLVSYLIKQKICNYSTIIKHVRITDLYLLLLKKKKNH